MRSHPAAAKGSSSRPKQPPAARSVTVLRRRCSRRSNARGSVHFTPHCLRHTYASIMLSVVEAPITYVQRQLGHQNIQQTVNIYGKWLPHASPHTIRGYLSDLRQFFAFAGAPGAVRADTIRHWLRTLDGTTERTSIARKLAAVRGLFRFLADRRRLATDPTLGIATPKTRRKLPAHLTLDDIDRLLATPRGDTLAGLRGRALLEVLYSSGLRLSDVVGLDWEPVDEDAGLPRVLGKGRKERVVPVGRPALRALAAYRARSAEAGLAVAHGPVFLNARGGRLTARSVARLMEPYVLASGSATKAT